MGMAMGMRLSAKIGMYISNRFVFQSIEYLIRGGAGPTWPHACGDKLDWIGIELVNK